MKTVLISVHEKYWHMIKNREKTLEIRKTKPAGIEYPFKVLCYVTGGKGIQGEFICKGTLVTNVFQQLCNRSYLSLYELFAYANGKDLVAWDVSSVKSYDIPIQIEEVSINRAPQSWCYIK
ncbi:hypothetical protein QTL86_10360 [Cellulosilyticum sp. ST5]|uniref:hypothetical protein n=1 Tax=Cellulosilyticum sp. ST5 TaxID=3055805 RepID=UPI003977B61B